MDGNDDKIMNAIAVIGMACRFPGASNPDAFWENLCRGTESITFFSDAELHPRVDSKRHKLSNYVKARGVLKDADKFDASFFNISPREAEIMDPQQRIFLEVAWEALENAGYNPETYDGLMGVYAGMGENTYFVNHVQSRMDLIETFGEYQTGLGNLPHYLATRVSYALNLKGPSVNVYTGCSTSLVAVCQAFDSLMNYQSDIVLAGGIHICCPQNRGYLYQEGAISSPDGHCRAFDAAAQGTVLGNGAGIVLLKRLEEALEDGDHIHGVLWGAAINNDGFKPMSFTAPSVDGQARVIAMAQEIAGIDPDTVTYIETHGTGTPLGDPIEIAALTKAFQNETAEKGFCAIGSVKSNIGHLDAAAGIAGFIKTVLSLKHGMLPPSLHFKTPNPKLEIEESPFYVNATLSPWDTRGFPRRAGVSSFGVGGTNAHVILEEAPALDPSGKSRSWQLLILSGKTPSALDRMMFNLSRHLKQNQDVNPADMAYTLMVGRKHFNYRGMTVFHSPDDKILETGLFEPEQLITSSRLPVKRDIIFMFSGQGSQYVNMGLDLYHTEKEFRHHVDHCSEILTKHLGLDLRTILYPLEKDVEQAEALLKQTNITQSALFVVEYALAALLEKWGVKPAAMVGHSIGEYVAACISGVFSLEDALALVAKRGQLIQALPGGSMMAVLATESNIRELIGEDLCLAVINGPSVCVVSGDDTSLNLLKKALYQQNIHFRYLKTSHAFHSKMLDPILKEFYTEVEKIPMNPPDIPFMSNVSGTWISSSEAVDPAYWVKHLRQTVRFSDCIDLLIKEENRIFLEIGPGQTLSSLVGQHPGKKDTHVTLSSTRRYDEKISDSAFLLNTLGNMWINGFDIDWKGFYANEDRQRVPLPSYPFEGERHWIEAEKEDFAESEIASHTIVQHEPPAASGKSNQQTAEKEPDIPGSEHEINTTLTKIWKDVLGLDSIDIHDNFFDLGGSSIVALSLFVRIEKVFGKRLPLATLYEAPTVGEMAEIFKEKTCSSRWSCLVPIQSNGLDIKPPFFLMHSHGGNVLEYYPLVKNLGIDQPVYAIQARGLDGNIIRKPTMEDMAEYYIQEIRSAQPHGPYYLGGFCFGGLLALEAARQLKAQGESVALVVLIQTATREYVKSPSRTTFFHRIYYGFEDRMGIELSNLSSLKTRAKLFYLFGRIKRFCDIGWARLEMLADPLLVRLFGKDRPRSMVYRLQLLEDAHEYAFQNYTARPYAGNVVHFTAKQRLRGWGDDPTFGLGGVLNGNTQIHKIQGYRQTLLTSPNVQVLADKLKIILEETMTSQSGKEQSERKVRSDAIQ